MKEKLGIVQTKEALIGVLALATVLAERLRDGVGVDDVAHLFGKLTNDEAFIKVLQDAYDKVGDVPKELNDVDWAESIELLTLIVSESPKLISAVQGKK